MKFVLILMIVGTFTTTTVAGQNETEIKKLTKDQCRQVLREDFQNSRNEKTLKELFCEFLTYGFDNEESMKMAKTSLTNGDLDKNGVIDGEEIYGRPN